MPSSISAPAITAARHPVSTQSASDTRRQIAVYTAQTLDVPSPSIEGDDELPSYSEHPLAMPPKYTTFKDDRQQFWHTKGLPCAVGAAAAAIVGVGGTMGASAISKMSFAAAMHSCRRIVGTDPELCNRAYGMLSYSAELCLDVCQTRPDHLIAKSGVHIDLITDGGVRGLLYGTLVGLTAVAAATGALAGHAAVASHLRHKRGGVVVPIAGASDPFESIPLNPLVVV